MKKTIVRKTVAVITVMLFPTVVFASKYPDDVKKAKLLHKAYRIQIPFIENRGQVENSDVSFYAKTFGGTLFVEKNGTLTYSFLSEDKGGVLIKEVLTGKKIKIKGLEPSPTRVNYFKGNDRSKWKTNIPSYVSILLGEIYKGINLKLRAYGKNIEKRFSVLPEGNPEKIKIKLQGAKDLKVNEKGELEVITKLGPIKFTKPKAYQEIDGKRVEVNVAYNIQKSGVRSQESEVRSQDLEHMYSVNFNPKSATRDPKSIPITQFSDFRNPKFSIQNVGVRNQKSESPQSKIHNPQCGDSQTATRNP